MKGVKSRNRTKKKRVIVGSALLCVVLVLGAVLGPYITSNASQRFPGVETIVNSVNTQNSSYKILEIVPESGMGEIGYYVKGAEENYITDQLYQSMVDTKTNGTEADRKTAFDKIRTQLIAQGICAESETEQTKYPLYGGDYKEVTFLPAGESADNWFTLNLLNKEEDQPYKGAYVENANHTGNYTVSTVKEGVEAAEGTAGNCDVSFIKGDSEITQEIRDLAATYGTYEYVDGKYKKISNRYQEGSENYYISNIQDDADGHGAYNYLYQYHYTPGTGTHDFQTDDGFSVRKVEVGQVYYQTGFTNNELLKHDVFQVADDDESLKNFKIEVTTMTPTEISNMSDGDLLALDFDMLYIAGDTSGKDKTYASVADNSETEQDISFGQMQAILQKIFYTTDNSQKKVAGDRSCVIDYSIFDNVADGTEDVRDSYIYKMATACLQVDVDKTYGAKFYTHPNEDMDWTELWNTTYQNSDKAYHGNYADNNVYAFKKTSTVEDLKYGLVSRFLSNEYKEGTITSAFTAVRDLIETENDIRPLTDQLKPEISQARVLQYIINAWNPRELETKTTIRVLELEPCNTYDLNKTKVEAMASKLIEKAKKENKKVTIELTQMTTAKFIGMINDLNTDYDMIYIGANITQMNKNAAGTETAYNDSSMDKLIYTHVGDVIAGKVELGGMLKRDYLNDIMTNYLYSTSNYKQTTTFSGNGNNFTVNRNPTRFDNVKNITSKNYTVPYVNVHDAGMYRYSGNDITSYKLKELEEFVKGRYAVVVDNNLYNGTDAARTVNQDRVDNSSNMFTFLDKVKDYDNVFVSNHNDKTVVEGRKTKLANYLNLNKPSLSVIDQTDTNKKTLSYKIKITNKTETDAQTRYVLKYYIDINADGQYSSKETISDCIVTSAAGEAEKDSSGNYLLRSDVDYTVTKTLASDYVGYISYKIEVHNSNNDYSQIRTSETGNEKFEGSSTGKEQINILQIMQKSGITNNMNLQDNKDFQDMVKTKVNAYSINVHSITSDEYVSQYNIDAAKGTDITAKYDMLILGFADVYRDIDNTVAANNIRGKGPVTAILDFIQSGKSVLFTHDTTSFINVSQSDRLKKTNNTVEVNNSWTTDTGNGDSYWGYNINSILRSVVGMDRFGITGPSKATLQAGNVLKTADTQITANDYVYVPRSARAYLGGEVQGYTNSQLDFKRLSTNDKGSLSKDNIFTGLGKTTTAKRVNSGQITKYPFNLEENGKDTLAIATTHFQYYQLDMEADDDEDDKSDIVVWYTLSGGQYEKSPCDVRNNYYIYSKGNVMYSGVGHSTLTGNSDEMKLFVNTMIAAYKNGVQNPTITFKESASITSNTKHSEYLTYDEAMKQENTDTGFLNSDKDLYFEVEDANITSTEKTLTAEYYVEDSSVSTLIPGTDLRGRQLTLNTYKGDTQIANDKLASGNVYKVTVPNAYQYLNGKSTNNIYVVIRSHFMYYGIEQNLIGYSPLSLVRTQLFDLN